MNKKKGVLSLITTAVLIAVLGFTVLVGFGKRRNRCDEEHQAGVGSGGWC